MDLDKAFKIAAKRFYEGNTHGNVDKYSKRPFEYSLEKLNELGKSYKKKDSPEEEVTEEVDNSTEEEFEW